VTLDRQAALEPGTPTQEEPDRSRTGRVLAFLDAQRTAVLATATLWVALVTVAPLATSPYRSDDKTNHLIPGEVSGDSALATLQGYYRVFRETQGWWITHEGRFFPGSQLWTFAIFTAFPTLGSYKVAIALLCLTMLVLTAVVAAVLTRSALVAPVAVVALGSTVTMRAWFDPLDSFSGVVVLSACLALGALLLLLRGTGWPSIAVAIAMWAYALVTYEVVITFTPVLCLVVWWSRRSWSRATALLWPTAVVGAIVAVLRSRVETLVGNAYVINLEPWRVLVTYVKQASASLPLSQVWYPGAASPPEFDPALTLLMVIAVGIPAAVILLCVVRARPALAWRPLAVVAFLGAALWLGPPVLIAISLGWQNELPPGQGYVSVAWGYVGLALLATSAWSALAKLHLDRPSRARTVLLVVGSAVLVLVCAASIAESITIARSAVVAVG
jgi:hypothetical protein